VEVHSLSHQGTAGRWLRPWNHWQLTGLPSTVRPYAGPSTGRGRKSAATPGKYRCRWHLK
jgi:hypothetical protein